MTPGYLGMKLNILMNNALAASLCVITYNQPDSIERFFQTLIPQMDPRLEILIRDDSPDDATEKVVNKYKSQVNGEVRYFRGEKSKVGGYDKALLFVSQKAHGKFLWWYGDDELGPGVVQKVIQNIETRPNMSFLWLNARDINSPSDRGLDLGGDKVFTDGSQVFRINIGLLGFPSITLLKREEAVRHIPEIEKFIGMTLTGYAMLLHVLSQKNREFVFLQGPDILSTPKPSGEKRWYDSWVVHGVNYATIALDFKNVFNRADYRKGVSDQFGRVWRAIIVERALGYETGFATRSPKIAAMTQLYWSYPEYYLALPLMLLPRFAIKWMYQLYKKTR